MKYEKNIFLKNPSTRAPARKGKPAFFNIFTYFGRFFQNLMFEELLSRNSVKKMAKFREKNFRLPRNSEKIFAIFREVSRK